MAGGNSNFLSGVPELMVLRLLQDREMYGYEIVQAIQAQSYGVLSFGEGVVYPVLHGLEKDGALKSRRRTVCWPLPGLLQPDLARDPPPVSPGRHLDHHDTGHPDRAEGRAACPPRLRPLKTGSCGAASRPGM